MTSYVHPDSLVETGWLAAHLDDPAVRILDATFTLPGVSPAAADIHAAGHIPGAVFFDIDHIADPRNPLPHMLPDEILFAEIAGALGIGDATRVVVYDAVGLMSAPRAWWMFRAFGHDNVAVLNGGLPKWRAEGRPLTGEPAFPLPTRFTARLRPEMVRDRAAVAAVVADGAAQLVDARAAARFEGTVPEPRAGLRSGHIPGSRNLPSDRLMDPETRTVLPAAALASRFSEAGLDAGRPVVASCGSGVTACVLAFGLHLLGREDVAVYDGSWTEWGAGDATPVETGPAR